MGTFISNNRQGLVNIFAINIVLMIAANSYSSKLKREEKELELLAVKDSLKTLQNYLADETWIKEAESRIMSKKTSLKHELDNIVIRSTDDNLKVSNLQYSGGNSKEIGTIIKSEKGEELRIV
eukprot:CAMPEP_0182425538 /NCGR_PEP_ID=MMETSP1167-20130531/11987_1 /TAXON_ID=2988 /ORGANISM="Mallomonas Sp, Strain CCMP3275" /LENGTH=122 /DNA_ID=CAMNT_0024606343 /DNA_START=217 /DNA_END=585 /DNA_ORIENTATION=+